MKKSSSKQTINKRAPFVSPGVQGREPRFKPGTFTKVMSVLLVVLSVALIAIFLLQRNGYHLINSAITYYLLAAAIVSVLIFAVYGMRRLVKRPSLKRTMTISATVLSVLLAAYLMTYISAYINYMNKETGRATSPQGENELVILRSYYIDFERMLDEARQANPDMTDEEIDQVVADRLQSNGDSNMFSFVYTAYPIRGGIFYYTNVEVGPEILIVAQDSASELRVRWEDEDTAVLYAADPGPYDRGEFQVKCK